MKRTILALLVTLAPTLAFAGPPTDAVKQANETISKQLKAQAPAAQVTSAVNNFIDIDELGKRSMTSHWSSLKPDEQKQFLQKLHALIEANYTQGMQANLNYQVDYVGEGTDPQGNITVQTKIVTQKKGRPVEIKVDYVLAKQGSNYRAWDIQTDGVGLVQNYGEQFDKIIDKDGFSGLIQKMDKKIAALNQAATTNGNGGAGPTSSGGGGSTTASAGGGAGAK